MLRSIELPDFESKEALTQVKTIFDALPKTQQLEIQTALDEFIDLAGQALRRKSCISNRFTNSRGRHNPAVLLAMLLVILVALSLYLGSDLVSAHNQIAYALSLITITVNDLQTNCKDRYVGFGKRGDSGALSDCSSFEAGPVVAECTDLCAQLRVIANKFDIDLTLGLMSLVALILTYDFSRNRTLDRIRFDFRGKERFHILPINTYPLELQTAFQQVKEKMNPVRDNPFALMDTNTPLSQILSEAKNQLRVISIRISSQQTIIPILDESPSIPVPSSVYRHILSSFPRPYLSRATEPRASASGALSANRAPLANARGSVDPTEETRLTIPSSSSGYGATSSSTSLKKKKR